MRLGSVCSSLYIYFQSFCVFPDEFLMVFIISVELPEYFALRVSVRDWKVWPVPGTPVRTDVDYNAGITAERVAHKEGDYQSYFTLSNKTYIPRRCLLRWQQQNDKLRIVDESIVPQHLSDTTDWYRDTERGLTVARDGVRNQDSLQSCSYTRRHGRPSELSPR